MFVVIAVLVVFFAGLPMRSHGELMDQEMLARPALSDEMIAAINKANKKNNNNNDDNNNTNNKNNNDNNNNSNSNNNNNNNNNNDTTNHNNNDNTNNWLFSCFVVF